MMLTNRWQLAQIVALIILLIVDQNLAYYDDDASSNVRTLPEADSIPLVPVDVDYTDTERIMEAMMNAVHEENEQTDNDVQSGVYDYGGWIADDHTEPSLDEIFAALDDADEQLDNQVQSGFDVTYVNEQNQKTESNGWHGSSGSSGYSESSSDSTHHYYYAGGIFPFGFGFCFCFYVARRRRRNVVLVRQQHSIRVTSTIPHQRFNNETNQGAVASVPPWQGQGQPGVWYPGQPVMKSKPTSLPAYRPEDCPPAYNEIIGVATHV